MAAREDVCHGQLDKQSRGRVKTSAMVQHIQIILYSPYFCTNVRRGYFLLMLRKISAIRDNVLYEPAPQIINVARVCTLIIDNKDLT